MSTFYINVGTWQEWWADASGDLPDNDRVLLAYAYTTSGSPAVAVIESTSSSVYGSYSLQINTSAVTGTNEQAYYAHSSGTAPFYLNVNNSRGYAVESMVKVINAKSVGGQAIYWEDGTYQEYISFTTSSVGLGRDGTTYALTTTDDFHKYRVACKDTEVKLYVDDTLRITGTLATTCTAYNKGLYFGDYFSTFGGESRYGYVRYTTVGNITPDEDYAYEDVQVQDRRLGRPDNIVRSHRGITSDNKMGSSRLRIRGTIAGSDYDSFRTSTRRLKKILHQGVQRMYLNDAQFIDGIHRNFSIQMVTQDYANFKAQFDCRQPFWQELWASYHSTAPVTTVTYYVDNKSDIPIPCKVIITGAASGTIDNNIEFTNQTTDETLKMTGVLQQTSEFVVDSGFDTYNSYTVTVDGASSFGSFEGDFMTLNPGTNEMVFDGGSVGTIEIYYRQAYLL